MLRSMRKKFGEVIKANKICPKDFLLGELVVVKVIEKAVVYKLLTIATFSQNGIYYNGDNFNNGL